MLDDNPQFGRRVSEILRDAGLSQHRFAAMCGWGGPYFNAFCTGKRAPTPGVARRILETLESRGVCKLDPDDRAEMWRMAARDRGYEV